MPSELSEDDALAEGAEILSRRKERQVIEALLRKRMGRSMVQEWMFWLGIAWCCLNSYLGSLLSTSNGIVYWLPPVISILAGVEAAAMKREQALLDWIKHQQAQEESQN
jgi:hypothetical protein